MNSRIQAAAPGVFTRGRRPVRALLLVLGLTLSQIVVAAGPAAAHSTLSSTQLGVGVRLARSLALAASVVVAGLGLLRFFGPLRPAARAVLFLAAGLSAAGSVAVIADGLPAARWVLLLVTLPVVAAAAVVAPRPVVAAASGGLVVLLSYDAWRDGVWGTTLMLAHLVTAALWLGAVVGSATAPAGERVALLRRLGPIAVGSAAALALTGVLAAYRNELRLAGLTVTPVGKLVVAKAALLLGAAAVGLLVRYLARRSRAAGPLARVELGVLLGAAVLGATVTGLPGPGPAATAGAPLVRRLVIDDAATGLVVVPQRPGKNLVHLATDRFSDIEVGGRRYAAGPRPGAAGLWAVVDLPAGRSRLQVIQGRYVVQQVLDTGPPRAAGAAAEPFDIAGPDGPECLAAALGATLGGSTAPLTECPDAALRPTDAAALQALVGQLAGRGVHHLAVLQDDTARSTAALGVLRSAAAARGVQVQPVSAAAPELTGADAAVAVSGWQPTATALLATRKHPPLYGTYVAPWLLTTPMVAAAGGSTYAPLPFDPQGEQATAYLAALRRVGPATGTESGFLAYLAARGEQVAGDITLYAGTSEISVMPMGGGPGQGHHGDDEVAIGWLNAGATTPVSRALSPR
jgi:putative copper export protein